MRGDKECPFSGVTKSGRVGRKVEERNARSVSPPYPPAHFIIIIIIIFSFFLVCVCVCVCGGGGGSRSEPEFYRQAQPHGAILTRM